MSVLQKNLVNFTEAKFSTMVDGQEGGLFVGLFITPIKVESNKKMKNVSLKKYEIFVLFSNFETKM